jgi:hypothetical protein
MVTDDEIVAWYNTNYNEPRGLFKKRSWPVTIDTSLTTGDYVWVSETGEEIMNNYFKTFNINPDGFDFLKYWPEESFILLALLPKCLQGEDDEPEPLTLRMLAESARAGKWLYG